MRYIKEILKNVIHKNTTNKDNATVVGASTARPSTMARPYKKTILITLPILILLITALIALGITNAAGNTTEPQTEQTFTEEGDGYYIWVRAVDHAGNKGPWSEAQRVWIDASGPSAPVITGGSSSYALSRTISVVTESDDNGASGVAYYEYYKKSGSDKPADNVNGTKVSTSTTSQTFNTNIAGDYVFFRAVDVVGNKGAWSDGQQVYIDTNVPTVTCNKTNSTLTITEGDNKTLLDYFTITPTGTNKAYTAKCKVGSTEYTTTESFRADNSPYTVTCTAAITGGNSNTATMTVVVESAFTILAKTTKCTDSLENSYVVPGGFGVRTDLATTVDKGIVIEDSSGNQFVWVPIGSVTKSDGSTVNIEFGRYSDFSLTASPAQKASEYTSTVTISSYYQELSTYRTSKYAEYMPDSNATAKDLQGFITNAIENGGYYIARYEASFGSGRTISSVTNGTTSAGKKAITNQKPAFKQSTSASSSSNIGTVTSTPGMLWNYIRQGDASLACQNLYAGNEYNNQDFVECDLVNSYAWDTAIMFIQKCSDKTDYANQTRLNSTLYNTGTDTGKTTDIACNIYDMAGNLSEWTTEYSSDSYSGYYDSCVGRGGVCGSSNMHTARRGLSSATHSNNYFGFRSVLYVL